MSSCIFLSLDLSVAFSTQVSVTFALAKIASMEPPTEMAPPPRKRFMWPVARSGILRYKYMTWREFKKYHYEENEIDDFSWVKKQWKNAEFAALFTEDNGKKVECVRVLLGDIPIGMPPPSSRTPAERKKGWPSSSPADIPDRPRKYLRGR